jgi:Uma2 family endonuclease
MTLSLAKWTIEDYHRMVDIGLLDDRPVELLHGEIVEMSPEGEAHAYFSTEAGDYLARLLGDKPDGIANAYRALVRHAKPITLPNNSEPEPDLAIV